MRPLHLSTLQFDQEGDYHSPTDENAYPPSSDGTKSIMPRYTQGERVVCLDAYLGNTYGLKSSYLKGPT